MYNVKHNKQFIPCCSFTLLVLYRGVTQWKRSILFEKSISSLMVCVISHCIFTLLQTATIDQTALPGRWIKLCLFVAIAQASFSSEEQKYVSSTRGTKILKVNRPSTTPPATLPPRGPSCAWSSLPSRMWPPCWSRWTSPSEDSLVTDCTTPICRPFSRAAAHDWEYIVHHNHSLGTLRETNTTKEDLFKMVMKQC